MNKKVITKVISTAVLSSMLAYTVPVFAYTKDETVYTKLKANGSSYQTIVSTHLENINNEKQLRDLSDLANIENTNGDETFSKDGNYVVWNANGKDIYYQGETSKKLPISCNVKYELDGKEISVEEIAGKSGKVKITLEYTNNEERIVTVNGKSVKMYVPFVVVAASTIDNSKNKNVEISSGKVLNDGSKTMAVGIALPGMEESLGISSSDLNIPSSIEITMDATDFEQGSIMTYITPKVLEDDDLKIFDKLDEVYSKVNTLQASSKQIVTGANTLRDGAKTYSEKSREFNVAMNKVSGGVSTVNSNYSKIHEGINTIASGNEEVYNGVANLNAGIGLLSSKLSTLPSGVLQLYQGSTNLKEGISGVNTGVQSLEASLNNVITNSISILQANNTTLATEISDLNTRASSLTNQITNLQSIKNKLTQQADKDSLQITIDELSQEKNTITTKITTLSTQKGKNDYVISAIQPTEESQAKISALNSGLESLLEGASSLEENLEALNNSTPELSGALAQLSGGSQNLVDGTKVLTDGAATLSQGSSELKRGINTLDTSSKMLADANGQLTDGANTLEQGVQTLTDGITTFDEQGIQKICNYINGDVKDISSRVEMLCQLSDEYNNYTMLEDGNDGSVKFIMIIDAIKKQEENDKNKEEAILDTDSDKE